MLAAQDDLLGGQQVLDHVVVFHHQILWTSAHFDRGCRESVDGLEGVASLWTTPPRGEVTSPGPRRARHAAASCNRGPFDAPRRQAQSSGAMSTLTFILDFFASVKMTPLTGVTSA